MTISRTGHSATGANLIFPGTQQNYVGLGACSPQKILFGAELYMQELYGDFDLNHCACNDFCYELNLCKFVVVRQFNIEPI